MHVLFRELIISVKLAKGAPPTEDGLRTVGTYRFQISGLLKMLSLHSFRTPKLPLSRHSYAVNPVIRNLICNFLSLVGY